MPPCPRNRTSRNRVVPRNATAPSCIVGSFLARRPVAVKRPGVHDADVDVDDGGGGGSPATVGGFGAGSLRCRPFQNEPLAPVFLRRFGLGAPDASRSSQAL